MRPSSCTNVEHRAIGSGALSSRTESRTIRIGSSDEEPAASSNGNSRPNKSGSNVSASRRVAVLSRSGTESSASKVTKGGSSGAQGAGAHASNCNPTKSVANGTTSCISGSEMHESQPSGKYRAALGPWSA